MKKLLSAPIRSDFIPRHGGAAMPDGVKVAIALESGAKGHGFRS